MLEAQFVGVSRAIVALLEEEGVTDVLINGIESLFVEKRGVLEARSPLFKSLDDLDALVERVLIPLGKRKDARQPYADGVLSDGSRFHIIFPPLAKSGPHLSIRRFSQCGLFSVDDFGDSKVAALLSRFVAERWNVLIAGGTGSGKTTLASTLLNLVSEAERIVLVEETREIHTTHPHVVSLEARTASVEGYGEVTLRTLIRNALRMRPSRVILGECRGEEAMELLQAMNLGHPGSFCTLHANGALDGLRRLEMLGLMSGYRGELIGLRQLISSALDAVVFMERQGGSRKVTEIVQVCGMEGSQIRFRPLWESIEMTAKPRLQLP